MRLVTRACLTQEQQPPENFARVDYFLIQDSSGYQGMLDTGTATRTSRGRVGCHTAISFLHFRHLLLGCPYHLWHSHGLFSLLLGGQVPVPNPRISLEKAFLLR
jgi:hypothetical protein